MIALHERPAVRTVAAEAELAGDLALALDPVLLAERVGLTPDPWQGDILRSPTSTQWILLCCRQSGKSSTSAVLAMHTAMYTPDSLTLLLSPSLRQSQELFRKCLDVYRAAGAPVSSDAETKLTLELANGSRIISLPGKEATIRGFSGVDLLVVDEASRVPDALYQAVRPMLAVSGGRIVLLSTPFGKRGFFFEEWENGGEDWERVKITAFEVPRIPHDWLERERRIIPEFFFQQEYCCEFVDTVDQVFAFDYVMAAFSDEIEPLFALSPGAEASATARRGM